jgi:hypothetical protein
MLGQCMNVKPVRPPGLPLWILRSRPGISVFNWVLACCTVWWQESCYRLLIPFSWIWFRGLSAIVTKPIPTGSSNQRSLRFDLRDNRKSNQKQQAVKYHLLFFYVGSCVLPDTSL